MNLLNHDNITLFIILFLPGFISVKIHRLVIADEKYDFTKNLFEIIGYSLLNYVLFFWLIFLNKDYDFSTPWFSQFSFKLLFSAFLILIAGPICWPLLVNKILKTNWIKPHVISDSKSAWDYHFSKRVVSWVIVHLKDGRKIGGKFGLHSFAAPYPCKETIFIEELWNLEDGKFTTVVPRTGGMLIISEDIFAIEFFN